MLVAVGVGAVAVAVLVILGLARWWRGGDTSHSVDDYRHTLETLQSIGGRGGTSVKVLGTPRSSDPSSTPSEGTSVVVPAPGPEGSPRAMVFDDGPPAGGGPAVTQRSLRTQRRALSAMNRGPRRVIGPVVVAVVVVVALGAVAWVGARSRDHHHPGSSSTVAPPRSAGKRVTAVTGTTGTRRGVHGRKTTTAGTATTTTTTTVPPRYTPIATTATTATYSLDAVAYSVTFATTTANCWIQVSGSSGATLFSQTLAAGQTKSLNVTGPVSVILGAPTSVAVAIGHVPVVLPPSYQVPFTLKFQPAALP
jgi:hypothetical protein